MNISPNSQLLSKLNNLSNNIEEKRKLNFFQINNQYRYTNQSTRRFFEQRKGNQQQYDFDRLNPINNELKEIQVPFTNIYKNSNKINDENKQVKNNIDKTKNHIDKKIDDLKNNKINWEDKNKENNNKKEDNIIFDDLKYEEKIIFIINSKIGLQNLGNSCYMNTCLQIIIHTPNFINRFYQNLNKIDYLTPISKYFYELVEQFNLNKNSLSPKQFFKIFCKRHSNFSGKKQNDTQEFCRIFLEDINLELNNIKKKTPYIEFETLNKSRKQCNEEYDILYKQKDDSIVIDSFYGQIINIFTCKCSFKDFSFQKTFDIPLLIPNDKKMEDLNELIESYFEEEHVALKCKNCSNKNMINQKKFTQLPEILILSLQRLNQRTNRKNTIQIKFEEKLKMKHFIDKKCNNTQNYYYYLYAIANHSGTIDYGHYYAYIKIISDWYEFNDAKVVKLKNIEHISSDAYIFFYRRNDI